MFRVAPVWHSMDTVDRQSSKVPADVAAAVEAAAESLVSVWDRSTEMSGTRVSSVQLRALFVVDRHGELNLNGLADELDAIPSSASRLCDRLEAAGLLLRDVSEQDRRVVRLRLSPTGRRLLRDLRQRRQADIAAVLARMPIGSRAALLEGLQAFRAADGSAAGSEGRLLA